MAHITKTAAIRAARKAVGHPIRQSSTSYIIVGPYRDSDPHGPCTEVHESSYPEALAHRARWVAFVALALMGKGSDEAVDAVQNMRYGSVPDLVASGLRASMAS